MSTDFRGLRPASNDPLLQIFVEMQKRLAKFLTQNQVDLIDSDNEDIYSDGQDMDTVIKYHSELSSTHKFDFVKEYFPPFEPDGDQVKMWLRGNNTGNTTQDFSGFDRFATIYGDPTLVDGTIDLGIHDGSAIKSIARRMNRPTSGSENAEWLQVPDSTGIQITDQTIGTSVFVRVRFNSLAPQEGKDATIFEKIDDSTPSNGILLTVKDTGKLVFSVKRAGTTYVSETAAATITTNTTYDIFVTYDVSGNVQKLYVNGIEKTLTSIGGTVYFTATLTNHDFFIFRRGIGVTEGFLYGDFYDLKYYRNRIVTQQEVTNHWTNKWSISDIPFGQVMITNYWATFWEGGAPPGGPSFTVTSFTSTSFTTV